MIIIIPGAGRSSTASRFGPESVAYFSTSLLVCQRRKVSEAGDAGDDVSEAGDADDDGLSGTIDPSAVAECA